LTAFLEKTIILLMRQEEIDPIIEAALKEDMPRGDVTSENIISAHLVSEAILMAKEEGVLAGLSISRRVFEKLDPSVIFQEEFEDGQVFQKGDILARLKGNSVSLLKGERTALNFLQRMCGIATKTREFVRAVEGSKTKILDTRKTTPGLRILEKYAVKIGGGMNHRANLSEMVLIKDNHLLLIGSISEALRRARENVEEGIKIEVEVTNLEWAKEAFEAKADMIMLDNMPLEKMKEVVDWVKGRVPIEVSGKITLKKARQIASLGVDFISVGALTHSNKSIDISLEFLS
jgi:nicotinate-nucleotide pyrophosphorylase (carboxylating)